MSNIKRELDAWGISVDEYKRLEEPGYLLAKQHVNVTQSAGIKHDTGKLPMHLIPVESLEEVAKVLAFGADKYTDWNWAKGFKWSRLYGATLRHLYAHIKGESIDKETNISHLAHAAANVLFLIYHELHRVGEDDRHPRPNSLKDKEI
jgi:hypothetical protein